METFIFYFFLSIFLFLLKSPNNHGKSSRAKISFSLRILWAVADIGMI